MPRYEAEISVARADVEENLQAGSLRTDLIAGRWALDRGTFLAYAEQISHWVGAEPPVPEERDALSAAVEWIWRQRADSDRGEFHAAGRRALRFAGVGVTMLWQARDSSSWWPGHVSSEGMVRRAALTIGRPWTRRGARACGGRGRYRPHQSSRHSECL
jgi:hypothetical protein